MLEQTAAMQADLGLMIDLNEIEMHHSRAVIELREMVHPMS